MLFTPETIQFHTRVKFGLQYLCMRHYFFYFCSKFLWVIVTVQDTLNCDPKVLHVVDYIGASSILEKKCVVQRMISCSKCFSLFVLN